MGAQCGRASARRRHRLGGVARVAHRFLLPPGSASPCRDRSAAVAAEAPLTRSYANPPRTSVVALHGPSARVPSVDMTLARWRSRPPPTIHPPVLGPCTISCAALATSEQILLGQGHRA